MTAGIQAAVVTQQNNRMKEVIKEKRELLAKGELPPNPVADEMKNVLGRLEKIEAKEKCLRVQFLDWLSDKLLDWSNRVHVVACKIDTPCLIEVAPRKRDDSASAKDSKELARMKFLLSKEQASNQKLHDEINKIASKLEKEVTK